MPAHVGHVHTDVFCVQLEHVEEIPGEFVTRPEVLVSTAVGTMARVCGRASYGVGGDGHPLTMGDAIVGAYGS